MKNNILYIVALLLSCLSLSCSNEKVKKNQTILLFDISGSLDSKNLQELSKKVKYFIDNLGPGDRFSILQIDDNPSSKELIAFYEKPVPKNAADKYEMEEKEKGKLEELKLNIAKRYQEVRVDPRYEKYRNSCITNSIIAAHRIFNQRDTSQYNSNLYIFSDMIEDCATSVFGDVKFTAKRYEQSLKLVKKAETNLPNLNYLSKVFVLLTLKYKTPNQGVLNENRKIVLWGEILSRFSISDYKINNAFSSTLD